MKVSELKGSRYLRKEDLTGPTLLTIKDVKRENVAAENQDAEYKGVMYFEEPAYAPMVLNGINTNKVASWYGDETNDWRKQKVVVYVDPTVEFGGRTIGGLRVKAPKGVKSLFEDEE